MFHLKKVPNLDFVEGQPRSGALFQVGREVSVHVLEDEVERHLALPPLAVGYVQKSVEMGKERSSEFETKERKC